MYFELQDSASIVSNSATSKHRDLKTHTLSSPYPCSLGNRFLVETVRSFVYGETMGMQNSLGKSHDMKVTVRSSFLPFSPKCSSTANSKCLPCPISWVSEEKHTNHFYPWWRALCGLFPGLKSGPVP